MPEGRVYFQQMYIEFTGFELPLLLRTEVILRTIIKTSYCNFFVLENLNKKKNANVKDVHVFLSLLLGARKYVDICVKVKY